MKIKSFSFFSNTIIILHKKFDYNQKVDTHVFDSLKIFLTFIKDVHIAFIFKK